MSAILQAEWTKARTLVSTFWLLAGAIAATIPLSVAVTAGQNCQPGNCTADPAKMSLTGLYLGQTVVAVLGVLAISGEYAAGMNILTFAAMPRRTRVLGAKAAVLTGLVLPAALVAVLGSLAFGAAMLPGRGFTQSHGFASLSLASATMLRVAVGSMLYLALIGLLSLGIATAVRDAAVAIGLVLTLMFVFPIVVAFIHNAPLQRHLEQIAPMLAGMAVQETVNVASQPLSPWAGLSVLALWAAGSLLLGWFVLVRRDALSGEAPPYVLNIWFGFMRVTMMLADHAQVADGKLFIAGGGWSTCGPGPTPCSVAVIFHVPWQSTNEKVEFSLRLVDEDGHPVSQPGPQGRPQPVAVNGQFEAGRPPGMTPGTEIGVPMTFGSVLHLPPGQRYSWVLEVAGHAEEDWRLSFATRSLPSPDKSDIS